MPSMDAFNSDAFSMGALASSLNKQDFQPTMLRSMGLFNEQPIRTTFAMVEERGGALSLIPTTPRGAPPSDADRSAEKRNIHRIGVPRIAKADRMYADEIQNIRAFGSESEFVGLQQEVGRRLNGDNGLMRDVELTWENMALGAIQGVVVDADDTTIVDWYNVFGVTQPAEVAFDFGNTAEGDLKPKITDNILRPMQRSAKGAMTPQTEVMALCGDNFYDDLTSHAEVRETFKHVSASQSERLRQELGMAFTAFEYGGVTWINYRGTDDNSTVAIDPDKAKFFPRNAPGVFQVARAPGEWADTVNTAGLPVYPMTIPDERRNAFVDIEVYSYPLYICTRPLMLRSGRRGA